MFSLVNKIFQNNKINNNEKVYLPVSWKEKCIRQKKERLSLFYAGEPKMIVVGGILQYGGARWEWYTSNYSEA